MNDLTISEAYYSIQCEGRTVGVPSVFIRLKSCNLICGGEAAMFDKKPHGEATWCCDTIDVWRKGDKFTFDELVYLFKGRNFFMRFLGGAHLVFTGGEPMLQQLAIINFVTGLEEISLPMRVDPRKIFLEIETNGTILPTRDAIERVDQWNVSPKLSNSGVPKPRRYNEVVIDAFAALPTATFKFVVSRKEDIDEIEHDFLDRHPINPKCVWLMPAGSDERALQLNSILVAELCKESGYKFSPRLQISIWNQASGV